MMAHHDDTLAHAVARLRESGRRRLREFADGYTYSPADSVPPIRDGEPVPAATREDALAVLGRLAHGVDAERLLERVAARPDAEALRAALCEIGAAAVTTGRRG
jgi:hypothetical protein